MLRNNMCLIRILGCPQELLFGSDSVADLIVGDFLVTFEVQHYTITAGGKAVDLT